MPPAEEISGVQPYHFAVAEGDLRALPPDEPGNPQAARLAELPEQDSMDAKSLRFFHMSRPMDYPIGGPNMEHP
jgi:hypothetical protein